MRRLKQGFTLVEIVVVMAIVSVLASIILGAIVITRNTAKETANRANAKAIQAAMEAARTRTNNYPSIGTAVPLSTAAANAALSDVQLDVVNACTTGTYNGGGRIVTNPNTGSPAYTITIGNSTCNGTTGETILGRINN